MSTESRRIQLADEALGRYYKQQNVKYLDNDGNGKFIQWVNDNGFDSEGIDEEFEEPPDQTTLVAIDEGGFPSSSGIDLKNEDIIAILRRCWEDPESAYTNEVPPLQITPEDWNFPPNDKNNKNKDIEETRFAHGAQCKTIFDNQMQGDEAIIKLLAVGRRLKEPYLSFLADMYSRDRIKAGADVSLQPADWALKNKHCIELKTIKTNGMSGAGKGPFTQTVSAVGSFFHRIVPKLMLNPQTVIVDSLEQTSRYITAAVDFVCTIARQPQLQCPFQVLFISFFSCSVLCIYLFMLLFLICYLNK